MDPLGNVPVEPDKFLKWLLGVMVILFVIWLMTGGYERVQNKDKPFIKPPSPLDSGEIYGAKTNTPN